jgi:YD repeat-containing protein
VDLQVAVICLKRFGLKLLTLSLLASVMGLPRVALAYGVVSGTNYVSTTTYSVAINDGVAVGPFSGTAFGSAQAAAARYNDHTPPTTCNYQWPQTGTGTQTTTLSVQGEPSPGVWSFLMTTSGCGQTGTRELFGSTQSRTIQVPNEACPSNSSLVNQACVCNDGYGPRSDRKQCGRVGLRPGGLSTVAVNQYVLYINGNQFGPFVGTGAACEWYLDYLRQNTSANYELLSCTPTAVYVGSTGKDWPNGVGTYSATLVLWSTGSTQTCGSHSTILDDGSCKCDVGYIPEPGGGACHPPGQLSHNKAVCEPRSPNPIFPLSGRKELRETLGAWFGWPLTLTYDTRYRIPVDGAIPMPEMTLSASLGEVWQASSHKALVIQANDAGSVKAVQAIRGNGQWVSFVADGSGNFVPDSGVSDRLSSVAGGWQFVDAKNAILESYDASGVLRSAMTASGRLSSYTYSDASTPASVTPLIGSLIQVSDFTGRSVNFEYEAAGTGARVRRVIDPTGAPIVLAYDAGGNLMQITWQDSTSRTFLHETAALPWAITGIVDENAKRFSTYGYDASGRAVLSQLAGGVARYSTTYTTPPSWKFVETYDASNDVMRQEHILQPPQGVTFQGPSTQSALTAVSVQNYPRMTAQTQEAGSGCSASSRGIGYDANGNEASVDDFNGARSCHGYDLARNLRTTTVEGLTGGGSGVNCSTVLPAGVSLPAGSRKVSSQWHPDWSLKTKEALPGTLVTSIYNGQPDPFNGGAVASCAPAAATLPNGKPIVVLCKRVEQATTDTSGSQGFSATVDTAVASKVWSYTYNQNGQVLTAKSPRTDVNDTTAYEYYIDTTVDHTLGDLKKITNAKGHVTQFTQYNKAGQVLRMVDANSANTDYTYDPRQRLKNVNVAGDITTYDYRPSGQLKRVTLPNASYVDYAYDDAQRLVTVADNLGNRIDYTLDNAGNRAGEVVRDTTGTLTRQLSRILDALGRVQQVTGRE